eukprot:CAMPEP_0194262348 /NCGR_PEP_ID=MMETSP0158-20130606/46492_1 /TAXON_ID=33649 /ORGANISM="Thalassionema nitzschioides, Strain L26-B" /LENGTH=1050 /DNA_ID=CAMNT_0039002503 /DNA_START=30 /DNA_END=3183 /DNA_ORIENTATION=-
MKFPSISLVALAASIISPVVVVAQSNIVFKIDGSDVSVPVSSLTSYDGGQDQYMRRPLIVSPDGRTVTLEGNIHRAVPLPTPMSIMANTILDIDVTIGGIQEAQALCIEENTNHSPDRCFVFAHTQDLSSSWKMLEPQTAEGETRHYTIPIGQYIWGHNKFNYLAFMQDNDSSNRDLGSSTFANIEFSHGTNLYIEKDGFPHYFDTAAQKSESGQDTWQHPFIVSDDGKSVQLKGNIHRGVPFDTPVVIDANTDIEFDFTLAEITEVHSLCFTDSTLHTNNCFVAANTQSWTRFNLEPRTDVGETRNYKIPVGLLYQGTFDWVLFMQDNDTSNRSAGDSTFSNIKLTQAVRPTLDITVNGVIQKLDSRTAVSARNDQDSKMHFFEFPDDNSILLNHNMHKALAITTPFEINKATELDFDFTVTDFADHHTICIVTDPTNIASYKSTSGGKRCFTVAGPQTVSWDVDMSPKTQLGETRHYNIPIGRWHPGGTAYYLVFVQDSDAGNKLPGESTFSNIEFSQRPDLVLNINGVDTGVFNHQLSYGSRQDFSDNLVDVSDDGKTASMYGNLWKAFELPTPVTITDDTVLSFTLDVEQELEIVSICFDEDLSDQVHARCLKLSGYQTRDFGTLIYKGIKQTYEGETKEYMIRLKEFYTGTFQYIALQHDNDATDRYTGISHISDISLHEIEPSCLTGAPFNFNLNECTVDGFVAGVQSSMAGACAGKDAWRELLSLWDGQSDSDVSERVQAICASAYPSAIPYNMLLNKENQFVEEFFDGGNKWNYDRNSNNMLLNKENQFVEEFFDGGNKWNYEVDEAGGPNLATDAARIMFANEKFDDKRAIAFPDVHNFEGCELRAAMCCHVAARDADSEPTDNSDACYMEFKNSRESSHVRDGYSIYPDDSEGAFACHGFVWGNDSGYADAAFKGNTLFDVALLNGLMSNKEVEELPGAPMCGCVEHMPVVSRADCTTTTVTQNVSISFNPVSKFTAEGSITNVVHESCGDLATHYDQLVADGKASQHERDALDSHLVGDGQCGPALSAFLSTKGFTYSP